MPDDPVRATDAGRWLAKARDDLRGAAIDLAADPPLVGDALFHCQQAVEKTMKAFLAWRDEPFRKTHDLTELGRQITALEPRLSELSSDVGWLTQYAWVSRYPGESEDATLAEAQEGLVLARKIVAAVSGVIPTAEGDA
jgi:HEPN domain-containing protein